LGGAPGVIGIEAASSGLGKVGIFFGLIARFEAWYEESTQRRRPFEDERGVTGLLSGMLTPTDLL
jgi:hypothetical protein